MESAWDGEGVTVPSRLVRRGAAAWRWMLQPWRSFGLIVALIASFAVPSFMAASADVFRLAAADAITRQAVEDDPGGLDATLMATGRLSVDGVQALEGATRAQLGRVDRLGEPSLTLYVPGADLGLQTPPEEDGAPAETIIGSGARFLARDGAIAALDVVAGDRSVEGLWISEDRSEQLGLGVGDLVVVNDRDPVPIAGVYANLWEGERDPYWDDLPAVVVPSYSSVYGGALFEVVVLPESLLLSLGVDGVARWEAAATETVETYAGLVEHATQLRGIERSYTGSDEMAAAIAEFAGDGGPVPALMTDTFDIRVDVDRVLADLDQPIETTAFAGIVLGLVVTAAGAGFAVRRRAVEMRLLRADGDAWWRFALRAIVQYLPAAVVGGALGVVAGWALIALPGEVDRSRWDVIEFRPIVWTLAAGLLVAAAVTAVAASRLLYTRQAAVAGLRPAWLLPLLGGAVAAWIQVGSAADSGEVDLLVVAFPLVGLLAGVGLVVFAARWLMRRVHRTGGSLPPALFFAWRRITSAEAGAVLLSAAMGVALGLIVFTTTLVDSLERATDAKTTAVVGGQTQAQLYFPYDGELPETTTIVRSQRTRLTIGGGVVAVRAIDLDTYADAVTWDPLFGGSAEQVVEALRTPVAADVAVVVAGDRSIPTGGGFGITTVMSYEIVGTVDSAPLVSEAHPTIIVRWDQMIDVARNRHEAQRPPDVDRDDWAATFRSPFVGARRVVVSQLNEEALQVFLAENDADVREFTTVADRERLAATRAAQWAFGHLGLLAAVAGLAAIGTMLFYLSEQRTARRISSMMSRRMGMRPLADAAAEVMELLGLVVIAYAAGASTAVLIAHRVFDRFEPDRRVPPDVGLQTSWPLLLAIAALGVGVVVIAALVNHRIAARRSYGEVLRDV
ncbi:MAG: hypothetical protein QNJ81_05405 [Acidimicrobiia bacterium]|nr:hypothetical protein [Acidimicrobiia bacterium]